MKLLLLVLALQAAPPQDAPLEWNHHLGAALRQAIQKKQQIVLLFSSKTCGWCRRMQEETFKDAQVKALLAARVLVHLDVDEASEIAQSLGATAVPDVRLYTEEGLPLAGQRGYLPADPFRAWLEAGAAAKPLADEPSLKALRLESTLDAYFDLEAKGKALPDEKLDPLLLMAAGPPGETRTEAMRLVRKWAPAAAPGLVRALGHAKLKVRLAAYEALAELGAPMGKLDPWAGPAAASADLDGWLKQRPAAPSDAAPAPAPEKAWTPALEGDLLAIEDEKGARHPAARERLIAGGSGLVPRLRERSRALRGSAPAAAARLDEIRFRILLTPAVLRRVPDAASRLAVGSAGTRSQALEDILRRSPAGLEGLVREAACDIDPLFRETAAASIRAVLGPAARDALTELLKDPETNVRAVALREMAAIPTKGTAEAIRDYLTREKDPDMVGHAVRSLQEVPTATSKEVLRSLLESPHWAVRGAAVKALMELKDTASLPAILGLMKDPDEFVIGQALAAIAKMVDSLDFAVGEALVAQVGDLVERSPQLVRPAVRALSAEKLRKLGKTDDILRRWARHPDGAVRAAAIGALASDKDRPAFEEVRSALEDKDALVRAAAAEGLRMLVDTKAVKRLIADSKRPDAYPDCRKLLLAGLKDPVAAVRLQCALTLFFFGDLDDAREAWKGFLKDPDPTIRKQALLGLRWYGPREALREIVLARWAAAEADERMSIFNEMEYAERDIESFDLLIELLPKIEEGERRDWWDAVYRGWLGETYYGEQREKLTKYRELAKALAKAAAEGGLSEDNKVLVTVLARSIDPEQSEESLRADLKHAHPMMRRGALAGLLRNDTKLSAAELEPLVRDPEPRIRALALVACLPSRERHHFDDFRRDWVGGKAMAYWSGSTTSSGNGKIVELPEKLLTERLEDADPDVRLRAAALMSMEGSDDALAYLHRAWRENSTRDLRQLLIRGVVGAWEDKYTSILEEILESFDQGDTYYLREMYQLIQPLKGTRVRAFRTQMKKNYQVEY